MLRGIQDYRSPAPKPGPENQSPEPSPEPRPARLESRCCARQPLLIALLSTRPTSVVTWARLDMSPSRAASFSALLLDREHANALQTTTARSRRCLRGLRARVQRLGAHHRAVRIEPERTGRPGPRRAITRWPPREHRLSQRPAQHRCNAPAHHRPPRGLDTARSAAADHGSRPWWQSSASIAAASSRAAHAAVTRLRQVDRSIDWKNRRRCRADASAAASSSADRQPAQRSPSRHLTNHLDGTAPRRSRLAGR